MQRRAFIKALLVASAAGAHRHRRRRSAAAAPKVSLLRVEVAANEATWSANDSNYGHFAIPA